MRTLKYPFGCSLALVGVLSTSQSLACQPPPGFVNPPLPEVAPLNTLISRAERKEVAGSMADSLKNAARPLEEAIRPTRDLPGVSGTFRLSTGPFGSVGGRRLVCLTDGNLAVEEVLHTESTSERNVFRYVVWNYTNPKYDDIRYAVGEFIRTQPEPNKTVVNWTYRFALKEGRDPEKFRRTFLDTLFADWMRQVFGTDHKQAGN